MSDSNDKPNITDLKSPQIQQSKPRFYLKEVNLDRKHKQLLNIFDSEIINLLKLSREGLLDKDGHTALVNLVKIYKEFRQLEKDYIETLSTEELEKKVAARNKDDVEE